MVSLSKLCKITEEGVEFQSPYDGTMCLLTPERSIAIQRAIGQHSPQTVGVKIELSSESLERIRIHFSVYYCHSYLPVCHNL